MAGEVSLKIFKENTSPAFSIEIVPTSIIMMNYENVLTPCKGFTWAFLVSLVAAYTFPLTM